MRDYPPAHTHSNTRVHTQWYFWCAGTYAEALYHGLNNMIQRAASLRAASTFFNGRRFNTADKDSKRTGQCNSFLFCSMFNARQRWSLHHFGPHWFISTLLYHDILCRHLWFWEDFIHISHIFIGHMWSDCKVTWKVWLSLFLSVAYTSLWRICLRCLKLLDCGFLSEGLGTDFPTTVQRMCRSAWSRAFSCQCLSLIPTIDSNSGLL